MYDKISSISGDGEIIEKTITQLVYLSIVPKYDKSVFMDGKELKAVPLLELYVALTSDYPSASPVKICLDPQSPTLPFYKPYQNLILE